MDAQAKTELYRKQTSDRLLLIGMIVSIPAAVIAGSLIYKAGLKLVYVADVFLPIIIIIAYITRARTEYRKRTLSLIFYVFFNSVVALHYSGLFGLGLFGLFFTCVIITTLFGLRWGLYLLSASVLVIAMYSLGVHLNLIYWDTDFNSLSNSSYYWVTRLIFFFAFSMIAVVTIGRMNKNLQTINKEVEESEIRFHSIFENANDAIFLLKNDIFIECNPKTLELFQCTRDQIIGQPVSAVSPKNQYDGTDSGQKAIELIAAAQKGTPQRFEWLHKRVGGSDFDAEVSLNSISIKDQFFLQAIVRDITERKYTEQQILSAVVERVEAERRKLAGDLHDEVGPLLSSLNMYLSLIERKETENKQEILLIMQDILKDTIGSVREISNNLSPHVLNSYGLTAAISVFVESKRKFTEFVLDENIGNMRFQSLIELTTYRIINELINNTLKYAHAKRINITIHLLDNLLYIAYQDDGIGFDYEGLMERKHTGMGLLNKANYTIQSKPGLGFRFDMKLVIDKIASNENSNNYS